MCLAVVGRVEDIEYPFAVVNFKGAKKKVRVDLIDDLEVGDYVLVHVGFAIQKVDSKEIEEYDDVWKEIVGKLG